MTAKSSGPGTRTRPTDGELEILQVLWRRGPSTVREVRAALDKTPSIGYTTVLKLMQIMAEKGLVGRDESQRAHVYYAVVAEEQTQRQLLGHLLERAFEGSAAKFMMQALSAQRASPREIAELRQMLDDYERTRK